MAPQARSVAAQGGVGERSQILVIYKMTRAGKGLSVKTTELHAPLLWRRMRAARARAPPGTLGTLPYVRGPPGRPAVMNGTPTG